MASAASSDLAVRIAVLAGLVSVVLTVGLLLLVLRLRSRTLAKERRRERFLAVWRPLLFEAALGVVPPLPELPAEEQLDFQVLWNQLQDGLRGAPRAGLNQMALAVDARGAARRWLQRRNRSRRLLALRTLGYIGQAADFELVLGLLDDPRPYLCVAAARALVHIDPRRAPGEVWRRLPDRVDWPVSQLAAVLREADREKVAELFIAALPHLSPGQLTRLLPLVSILDEQPAAVIAGNLLHSAADAEVLAAALRHVRAPALLPHVARLCRHGSWPVRMHAAAAVGRIGGRAERDVLVPMLGDPEWWVRYRAAKALVGGSFGTPAEIGELAERLRDRFARDIVAQAVAEVRP